MFFLVAIMITPGKVEKRVPPMRVHMIKIRQPETVKEETKVVEEKIEKVETKPKVEKKVVQSKPKPKPKTETKKTETKKTSDKPSKPTSVKVEDTAFDSPFYINLILTKVTNNWLNPIPGTRTRLQTVVYFRILRDGKVKDLKVHNSSGSPIFDSSALKAITLSQPFPPLPDEYKTDHLGIYFEFEHSQ